MIASQNVSSEAQVKIFLFHRKAIFHSQDIQVFLFSVTKSVMSWARNIKNHKEFRRTYYKTLYNQTEHRHY